MIYDNFFIDKITNSIENALTGQVLKTDVLPFTSDNLKEVLKKYGWCKLGSDGNNRMIVGLLCENSLMFQKATSHL